MNWEDDEHSDDWQCEHCGTWHPMVIGMSFCGCPESEEASRKKSEDWDRRFKGNGRVRGKILIEYECYDSDLGFSSLMDCLSLDGGFDEGENKGNDKTLGVKWRTKHARKKV